MKFRRAVLNLIIINTIILCSALIGCAQQQLPEIIWDSPETPEISEFGISTLSIKFSPDNQRIYSGGDRQYGTPRAGRITVFNASNGNILNTTQNYFPVTTINELDISNDGLNIVTAHNGAACGDIFQNQCNYSYVLYNAQTLNRVREPATTYYASQSVDYSPDNQMIAVGDFSPVNNIKFLNPTDLSLVRTLPGHFLGANNGRTLSVRFSPDGRMLASGGGDGKVKIWRVSDGSLLQTFNMESLKVEVFSVEFSPDGQYLAAADRDNTSKVKIWRVSDGVLLKTFINPEFANISSHKAIWTRDGRYIVTTFITVSSGSRIRFWDFNTGALAREYTLPYINAYLPSSIHALEFSPDGRSFAFGIGPRILLSRNPFAPAATFVDFDGDQRSDPAVFRGGIWHLQESRNGAVNTQFGIATDTLAPADFDGDGKTDLGVFRAGVWYWINSSDSSFKAREFGQTGDVPVPADYTGDGRAELAVYRGGVWWTHNLANNQSNSIRFGIASDKTVPADYDGDGRVDYAVFRGGVWHCLRSSDNSYRAMTFGLSSDIPVVGDYDGDGQADQAVYRSGIWYISGSRQGFYAAQFGLASDLPAAADYDGDGKTDPAVFRDGIWYLLRSQAGFGSLQFGTTGDQPIQSAYMP